MTGSPINSTLSCPGESVFPAETRGQYQSPGNRRSQNMTIKETLDPYTNLKYSENTFYIPCVIAIYVDKRLRLTEQVLYRLCEVLIFSDSSDRKTHTVKYPSPLVSHTFFWLYSRTLWHNISLQCVQRKARQNILLLLLLLLY